MVTFVPPDSGPLLGDRPVTVGVYKPERKRDINGRLREQIKASRREWNERTKQEPKRQTKRWIFSGVKRAASLWHLSKPSRIITDPQQITVIHIARPMTVECSAGGRKEDKTRSS